MHLTAVNVTDSSKEYEDFISLYHTAFPPDELIPEDYLFASLHMDGAAVAAYYADDLFVGFTYVIDAPHFLFLYFFAVNPELRSQGFGSEIIREHLMKRYPGKPIVLNVEVPDETAENNALRLRRIAFYQRAGFVSLKYRLYDKRVLFNILSTSSELPIDEYEAFLKQVYAVQNLEDTVEIFPYPAV
ncbi:MAG TPA: GNAT family N-acetyltransferase [Methanocorpusculum sp.]|nr:GNAT family N-acetyltransferase [Methanocorpusculum sp.]